MWRVLKTMQDHRGETIRPGDLVDATGWRNLNSLVNTRYLEPITTGPASSDGADALAARVAELEQRVAALEAKPKRGRPPGSRNKAKASQPDTPSTEH